MAPRFIIPKPLLVAATVVLLEIISRAGAAPYCGQTLSVDQTYFPPNVDQVLQDLVTLTPKQNADATTGETTYATTYNSGSGSGYPAAAAGNATCYRGTTGTTCGECLSDAREYVIPCRTFTTGGAFYDQKCFIQFWQPTA